MSSSNPLSIAPITASATGVTVRLVDAQVVSQSVPTTFISTGAATASSASNVAYAALQRAGGVMTGDLEVALGAKIVVGASNGAPPPQAPLHVRSRDSGSSVSILADFDIASMSDLRLKRDLRPIEGALARVRALTGYTFARRHTPEAPRSAGLVAQEVREVLPEAVQEMPGGDLSVAYGNVVALLVEAIKELDMRSK
jgi:hypothetical protein